MTGEHEHRDDEELERKEGEDGFVLEDWRELDDVLAEVETRNSGVHPAVGMGSGETGGPPGEESPEDLLFQPTTSRRSRPDRFAEDSEQAWAGHDQDPESIGIPVHRDAEEVELELDEDEAGADADEESGFFHGVEASEDEAYEGEGAAAEWDSGDAAGEELAGTEDLAAAEPTGAPLAPEEDFEEIILEDALEEDDVAAGEADLSLAMDAHADAAPVDPDPESRWEVAAEDEVESPADTDESVWSVEEEAGSDPVGAAEPFTEGPQPFVDTGEVFSDAGGAFEDAEDPAAAAGPHDFDLAPSGAEPEDAAAGDGDDPWAADGVDLGFPGADPAFQADEPVGEEEAAGSWEHSTQQIAGQPLAASEGAVEFELGVQDPEPSYDAGAFGDVDPDWAEAPEDVEAGEGFDEELLPEDAADDDPIYGQREDELPPEDQIAWAPSGEAEHDLDDQYVDAGPQHQQAAVVRGGTPRRRMRLRAVGASAVTLLAAASLAAVFVFPEWLGMRATPHLVDRTEVARPSLEIEVPPPPTVLPEVAFGVDLSVGRPVVPEVLVDEPVEDPVAAVDPATDPVADPVTDPVTDPVDPGTTDPVAVDPVTDPGRTGTGDPVTMPETGTDPSDAGEREAERLLVDSFVPVGEELQMGPSQDELALGGGYEVHPMAASLVAGDKAFAQLENGNYFVGVLKSVGPEELTLRLERGELTLAYPQLRALGTLQSPEYLALRQAEKGAVKLTNDNRIVGSILRDAQGRVTVEMESNRVLIPSAEIESISEVRQSKVEVGSESDDVWVREFIERRLRQRELGTAQPAPGATPPPDER